nr:type I-E CRISPR-associated protein Cse1/CasA [uncultured Enterobacter sp.]
MDLVTEPWLPVISRSGEKRKIALDELFDNSIHDVDYPRADFQGAAWQMLIGLLQSTVAPEDEEDWDEIWGDGISNADWQKALASVAHALQFGAQKPAFLQSFEPLETENSGISGLLIDSPGGNTLKLNKDHFVKRHAGQKICPHCAVMALFTVQTNSPAGGAGYRVSLRGGGPLTTLIVPLKEADYPLWKKLWLNVLPAERRPTPSEHPVIFPWLAPTKTSEKAGNIVTEINSHWLQAYWGMPRRIELDFEHTQAGECDLCGEHHDALLLEMRNKNYGVQYDGWRHPLSPYYQALKDKGSPAIALKGQPGGLSYKDWLGLTLACEDKFNRMMPARVVAAAAGMRHRPEVGLWCFAWDMDNAKARCWYQHRLPLLNVPRSERFISVMAHIMPLTSDALTLLKKSLKAAWFSAPGEAKVDFSMLNIAYWQETESAFRHVLDCVIRDADLAESHTRQAVRQWVQDLLHHLMNFFDRDVLTDPDCDDAALLRQVAARRGLVKDFEKLKSRKDLLALAKETEEQPHV